MWCSDFSMVGNFCCFYSGTGWCWVACNPWADLSYIVASFYQWHTIAWGLPLLLHTRVRIYFIGPNPFVNMLMMPFTLHSYERMQESADKKFGNMPAYRLYKKTTRSTNPFGSYRFTLIQSGGGANLTCSLHFLMNSLLQPSDSIAPSSVWEFTLVVEDNTLWIAFVQP